MMKKNVLILLYCFGFIKKSRATQNIVIKPSIPKNDVIVISQYKKYHNTLCLSTQNFAETLFPVSFGIIVSPKRKYKQCLCNILGGQTKCIMVFFVLANSPAFRLCLYTREWCLVQAFLKQNIQY